LAKAVSREQTIRSLAETEFGKSMKLPPPEWAGAVSYLFFVRKIIMKNSNALMEVNGLFAAINTPEALESSFYLTCEDCGYRGEVNRRKGRAKTPSCPECRSKKVSIEEQTHGLPPHDEQPAFVVDEYPGCPKEWMHGSSKAGSFFVPVETGRGMWFDFTRNQGHNHHVAVVCSVQGINPVTGLPTNRQEWMGLQQIKNQCPRHKVDLQQNRYCPECGYELPAQNYIATTTGQMLWLDGFRNEKGQVRQYIITEEEMRGVASQVIGDDRVWAIGFAFYLSKEEKPQPVLRATRGFTFGFGGQTANWVNNDTLGAEGAMTCSVTPKSATISGISGQSVKKLVSTKRQEIGAGAQIDQEVGVDPKDIDFWEPEPAALIYVNYVQPVIAENIINAGKRQDKKDGFLEGLTVGN
jgi:hypothetical protein